MFLLLTNLSNSNTQACIWKKQPKLWWLISADGWIEDRILYVLGAQHQTFFLEFLTIRALSAMLCLPGWTDLRPHFLRSQNLIAHALWGRFLLPTLRQEVVNFLNLAWEKGRHECFGSDMEDGGQLGCFSTLYLRGCWGFLAIKENRVQGVAMLWGCVSCANPKLMKRLNAWNIRDEVPFRLSLFVVKICQKRKEPISLVFGESIVVVMRKVSAVYKMISEPLDVIVRTAYCKWAERSLPPGTEWLSCQWRRDVPSLSTQVLECSAS